ncbi:RNA-binding protein 44 [Parambassis ranga]|uniref:RNA-binding protein 44 n=1 Tax=Parambassis ranga TaxID=210632 RepID=A0A6P7KM15_9TELE|nr:RNA-binding protein 44 [Parambassis ranga]
MTTEGAESSILYISNLPNNVTEDDVMLLCEKYQPSDVSISALKNGFRVAIVMVSSAQAAEAAVRELNGYRLQGYALHLEHISRAVCGSELKASQDANKPQTSNTDTSNANRKLKTPPPLGSSVMRKMLVSDSPTAKGTFVPQHYGTMASFDTLMADLTKHHPEVGKRRIMDALMELGENHRGILSSLPLGTISEMMSDILTRQAPNM